MAESLLGRLVELEIGTVAHGGHCVARLGGDEAGDPAGRGRVVFVRHALPGELATVQITEDSGKSYCRGDAVKILRASPARVEPPCPYAGPGRCGGCDWQHVATAQQRRLKADVVQEQLLRLAGLDRPVTVEELPGGYLGWRTRIQYAVDAHGAIGLRKHRSHQLQPLSRCLIGAPGVGDAAELGRRWPGATGLAVALGDNGERTVSLARPVTPAPSRPGRRGSAPGQSRGRGAVASERLEILTGARTLSHEVDGLQFRVAAHGFWQVHPHAAPTLTAAVLDAAALRPGERVLDLYAGAGLFTAAAARAVGVTGSVDGLEADRRAAADALANLVSWPWARVQAASVTAASVAALGSADVVVLDPPRTGAGGDVIRAVLAGARRAVVYVACDPAALARDVRYAADSGWTLSHLRAFDLFPMTQHVECVARLEPA